MNAFGGLPAPRLKMMKAVSKRGLRTDISASPRLANHSHIMLRTLVRRSAQPGAKIPFNIHNNPYKAKRTWPPDFTKLSPKHQFRIERKYRRRTALKWERPKLTKAVKLAQWGAILCTRLNRMSRDAC